MAKMYDIMDKEDFKCKCGNDTISSGFYPCNEQGEEIEPYPENWPKPLYVCAQCKKIYYMLIPEEGVK